jgi:hypothetical protein
MAGLGLISFVALLFLDETDHDGLDDPSHTLDVRSERAR